MMARELLQCFRRYRNVGRSNVIERLTAKVPGKRGGIPDIRVRGGKGQLEAKFVKYHLTEGNAPVTSFKEGGIPKKGGHQQRMMRDKEEAKGSSRRGSSQEA